MAIFPVSELVKSLSHVRFFETPWTVAYQAPPFMEFSRQKHWSGLPFPFPGDLPDPEIKPVSPVAPALAGGFFTTEPAGKSVFPTSQAPRWKLPKNHGSCFICLLSFTPRSLCGLCGCPVNICRVNACLVLSLLTALSAFVPSSPTEPDSRSLR